MKAVIMAGGRGTRVASICHDIPKPMLPLCGKPVLERQIECLRAEGFCDIVLVIGYLGQVIKEYFADGSAFGVQISYVEEREPLGTAGALALMREMLAGDDFLLLCGDLLFDVNFERFLAYHRQKGGIATVLAHPNDHPFDSSILRTDKDGRVTAWLGKDEEREWYPNRVNAGLHFFSPRVLDRFNEVKRTDLDRDVLRPLMLEGELFAYDSPEYVKDMGRPERLAQAEEDLNSGRVAACNLRNARKAVFLDRDGTINVYEPFLCAESKFELIDRAAEAIRAINRAGLLAVVVTNQPMVARGDITHEGLAALHEKMETLLGREGAYIDDLFYCPHHPHKGFEGEVPELKIVCDCRKPEPGLLLRAAEKYNIDLCASYIVGDRESDCEAGRRAGCHTAAIGDFDAEIKGADLYDCVMQILEREGKV